MSATSLKFQDSYLSCLKTFHEFNQFFRWFTKFASDFSKHQDSDFVGDSPFPACHTLCEPFRNVSVTIRSFGRTIMEQFKSLYERCTESIVKLMVPSAGHRVKKYFNLLTAEVKILNTSCLQQHSTCWLSFHGETSCKIITGRAGGKAKTLTRYWKDFHDYSKIIWEKSSYFLPGPQDFWNPLQNHFGAFPFLSKMILALLCCTSLRLEIKKTRRSLFRFD